MDRILSLVKNLLKEFSFSPIHEVLYWQEFQKEFRKYYLTGKEFTERIFLILGGGEQNFMVHNIVSEIWLFTRLLLQSKLQ